MSKSILTCVICTVLLLLENFTSLLVITFCSYEEFKAVTASEIVRIHTASNSISNASSVELPTIYCAQMY